MAHEEVCPECGNTNGEHLLTCRNQTDFTPAIEDLSAALSKSTGLEFAPPVKACRWCGGLHLGESCPDVRSMEFYENGFVKRVEFLREPVEHPSGLKYFPGTAGSHITEGG
jgi:RNA polymerase subunit RPABC4/transcription elongation factor Spt4